MAHPIKVLAVKSTWVQSLTPTLWKERTASPANLKLLLLSLFKIKHEISTPESCSAVRSISCSCRGPGLNSQDLHGSSQSSVWAPGGPVLSSDLMGTVCVVDRHRRRMWTLNIGVYKSYAQDLDPGIFSFPVFKTTNKGHGDGSEGKGRTLSHLMNHICLPDSTCEGKDSQALSSDFYMHGKVWVSLSK